MKRAVTMELIGQAPEVTSDVTMGLTSTVAPDGAVVVGVASIWWVVSIWVVSIILVSQALKSVLKLAGVREKLSKRRWKRLLYVIPVVVGMTLAHLFAPRVGILFGLEFDLLTSVLILGPGSGAGAAFVYDTLRTVVMPVLPRVVVGVIERVTGVELPESARNLELSEDSEAE